MSSDSETELFYDAEEATPIKVQRDVPVHILEEEEEILEAKRLAEERRRAEDAEIERKLAELEKRKQQEVDKTEAERKLLQNVRRRKKLEELRETMAEDGSPIKPPPKPPRMSDVEEETTLNLSGKKDPEESHVASQKSSLSFQEPNIQSEVELRREVRSESKSDPEAAVSDIMQDSININMDLPECDILKVQSKDLAELAPADASPSVSENSSVVTLSSPEEPNFEPHDIIPQEKPEPDIVQSTKKEPPPRPTGPPPVAPPRTKRNKTAPPRPPPPQGLPAQALKPPQQRSDKAKSEPGGSGEVVRGLPTETSKGPSPTSTVLNIIEQSLNMHSATSGARMVTAKETEDVSTKAVKTEEEAKREAEDSCTDGGGAQQGTESGQSSSAEKREKRGDGTAAATAMRPRSNSGSRFLTDEEILEKVLVLNLDTGEAIPLSQAEEKLPQCVNPLSLHIMRRTKEYSSDSSLHKHRGSDDESKDESSKTTKTIISIKPAARRKTQKMKKLLSKGFTRLKTAAGDMLHGHDKSDEDDEEFDERSMIKVKASSAHKGPYDFDLLVPVQDLKGEQNGAIWTMKFSHCGRLLATGGQDNLLRVWVLKDSYAYFDDMRQKYSEASKVSPTPSQDSLSSQASETSAQSEAVGEDEDDEHAPFMRKPFCVYRGHTADLLDLSWSKNYFILSSSMDKTVRLWHVSRKECLCCFQHIDFVTAIAFHPRDDRYFLSGSLDGKLRLWSIPDKKVALWNEVLGTSKLITAASFCLGGKFAVCGTYDGRCIFYSTEQLKYFTQIHVRSTRGRNARGRKITGIECLPGEDKILVTSNDSRIRLYDLRDLTLTCKYRGCANNSSQIKASFSHNGKYIICGSEDHFVYIWRTQHDFYRFTSARRDRNVFWEGIKAHNAVVTVAIFAPNPGLIIKPQFEFVDSDVKESPPADVRGEVLVSADFTGSLKVFINKFKPGSG